MRGNISLVRNATSVCDVQPDFVMHLSHTDDARFVDSTKLFCLETGRALLPIGFEKREDNLPEIDEINDSIERGENSNDNAECISLGRK
ncbi:hypothetical protein Tco_1113135 [Tanacetum coccineum]|uniref:Uncharacterized protein n=1 Tax=Tanacetum coccineum TaxID=301880 RepID=A0ABQ5IRE8_9ASTR